MLFSLELTNIHFQGGLPKYPSLVDYTLSHGLQLEPAVKGPQAPFSTAEFEVIFRFNPTEQTRFRTLPTGRVSLSRVDGAPVEDENWVATPEEDAAACRLQWVGEELPGTQVVRLDCGLEREKLHLFFTWIDPMASSERSSSEPLPLVSPDPPPQFVLTEVGSTLIYEIFLDGARDQLQSGCQFDPAFRVPRNQQLQFEILLEDAENTSFAEGSLGSDQVPVVLYVEDSLQALALRPTLRPDGDACIVTWKVTDLTPAPPGRFLSFNLALEHSRLGPRRRVDPTVIEDPHVIPEPGEDPESS